ncbi:hypothetical protein V2O64_07785 [Verrucomicrobiaceae bacterium 227]
MLKTLRDQEREKEEKGEIVTRSDGSVARKVKRRRRRSDQPDKPTPEKVKKRLIYKVLIGVSLCLFAALGVMFLLISFNSKSYREKVEARASEWTGASVDLDGLKLLPSSVDMKSAEFSWPESSYLRSLSLKRIDGHANLLSFVGARMGGLEVGGAVGEMQLGMPVGTGTGGQSLDPENFPFDFGRYYCDALDVSFGDSKALALKGASVSLRHLGEQGFRAGIDQGTLILKGWTPFPIANGLIQFEEGGLDLIALTLEKPANDESTLGASMKLSGAIPLQEGKETQLTLTTNSFPAKSFFGLQMGQLFEGEVRHAEGSVTYTMGEDHLDEFVAEFTGDYFELKSLPFLNDLKELFPKEGYDDIVFETNIKGVMRARPGGVALESLEMNHKDLFRLKGNMIVSESGQLGGRMTLWINRGLIISEPRLKNFPGLNKIEPGYSRVDFELKGTANAPQDTFRIVTGLQASLPGVIEPKVDEAQDLWKLLTPNLADEE